MFAKHHYLSHAHNNAARVFVMTVNDVIAGFCSALYFPHPKVKTIWREHRLVVLPDFQGIGLGSFLSDYVAQIFKDQKKRYRSTTSNVALMIYRAKSKEWIMSRSAGRVSNPAISGNDVNARGVNSSNRRTVSFEYVGNKRKRTDIE